MLDQHEPFPAVVMDRRWDLQRANHGAALLFGRLFAPNPVPDAANVLQLVIEPGPIRDHITNWKAVVPGLLERARREAVEGVLDPDAVELVAALRSRVMTCAMSSTRTRPLSAGPVIDLRFDLDGVELSFFSVVSTIGTPIDVTAQELRVEVFFPADDATAQRWASINA